MKKAEALFSRSFLGRAGTSPTDFLPGLPPSAMTATEEALVWKKHQIKYLGLPARRKSGHQEGRKGQPDFSRLGLGWKETYEVSERRALIHLQVQCRMNLPTEGDASGEFFVDGIGRLATLLYYCTLSLNGQFSTFFLLASASASAVVSPYLVGRRELHFLMGRLRGVHP